MSALRTAAVSAIRRLDHAAGRLARNAHVLVDVRTPMNLAVLRPVWSALAVDDRLTLAFTAEDEASVGHALEDDRLAHALVARRRAAWARFDLAVTADAWNHAPLHRCRRRINFFHGVAGKYDLDRPSTLARATFSRFDRVAFINADRLERYVRSGAINPDQAVLVGFPKSDDLVNGVWPAAEVRARLGLQPSRATILYAPTFSSASSLHLAGEAIIEHLLDTGCNVIVKLHDRSMVPHEKYTNGIDWPARLARYAGPSRYALARGADAGPYLAASDVLVTDHSTVGFEFAMLDRPIVVFDAPALKEAARIDDDKWTLLRSMADVVDSPRALRAAVEAALTSPAIRRAERRRAHALFAHAGSATVRALDVVYELLEMPREPARRGLGSSWATPRL